jgi:DNA-binding transcriptional ArsR family regulator
LRPSHFACATSPLVAYDRDGKRAIYRLADAHVAALLAEGLDHAHEDGPA